MRGGRRKKRYVWEKQVPSCEGVVRTTRYALDKIGSEKYLEAIVCTERLFVQNDCLYRKGREQCSTMIFASQFPSRRLLPCIAANGAGSQPFIASLLWEERVITRLVFSAGSVVKHLFVSLPILWGGRGSLKYLIL
jgi:hypothetical protein